MRKLSAVGQLTITSLRTWFVPAILCCLLISACTKSDTPSEPAAASPKTNSPGKKIKDPDQLVGTWFHVGKSQQFFGEDIVGIEFLKGGKMLLTGASGNSVTWDYSFQQEGRISVSMGATDIWTCSTNGDRLTVEPASEPGEKYEYRRLSGQSITEAHRAEMTKARPAGS